MHIFTTTSSFIEETLATETLLQNMQGKFQNDWHKLRVGLLKTAGWLRSEVNKILEPYDLTQQQFNILRILRGAMPSPISTADLKERLIDKNSDTSRLVDRLIVKKLVSKKISAEDKRLVDVMITQKGLAQLEKIDEKMNELDGLLKKISPEQAKVMNEILDTLMDDKS